MTIRMSTLSPRGQDLVKGSIRKKFGPILEDMYDREKNPNGFVNIAAAENYAMLPELTEFVNTNFKVKPDNLHYGEGPWGCIRLRKAMAHHMHANFPTVEPIDPEKMIFANGVTSICEMLGWSLMEPGDGLLLSRPIYQGFQMDFGLKAQVKPVHVSFSDVDQFSPEGVEKYEAALLDAQASGTRVRAMMLCNPHNPLGRCYPKDTIIAIMKFCQKYSIHLLCDEIYALSIYGNPEDSNAVKFTSVLSFDSLPYISTDYLHVIYGMSKDEGAGGLRLGCMYTQNTELMDAMSAISPFHWTGEPHQIIASLMLENQKWMKGFVKTSLERLAANRKIVTEVLDELGVEKYPGANAGFFLWVNLAPFMPKARDGVAAKDNWEGEMMIMQKFMQNKVFMMNGAELKSEEAGWFRFVFSQDETILRLGLERVVKALKETKGTSLPPLQELTLEEDFEGVHIK